MVFCTSFCYYTFQYLYLASPMIDYPSTSTISAVSGTHLTLSCTSQGSPPDTFTWRKDSGPTINSTSITTLIYTNTSAVFHANYSIDSVTTCDSGTYTCTVTNPIGTDNKTIIVTVTGTYLHTCKHVNA